MDLLFPVLFVCYTSYAYNRKSVALSLPSLKVEGMDTAHAGLIISSQNLAFAISKFIAGVLSDRINPNILFASGLFLSGFATISFSASSTTSFFCGLWFINGLAQGCGWPSIAKILRQRASPSQFGTMWSLMSSSINVAGSLSPFLAAFFIFHFGWRWNVFLAGFLSLFLGVIFLLYLPFSSPVDPEIEEKKKSDGQPQDSKQTIRDLFMDPFIWLLSISFMVVFCARTTAVDWGQLYLIEERKQTHFTASAFTSSVESGGFVGRILAGYFTDWVIKKNAVKQAANVPRSFLRLSVAVFFSVTSVLGGHFFRFAVTETSSSMWIVSVGAMMGMSFYALIAILGIVAAESVPPHLSGSSNAIVSLFGNIGAIVSGLPFSYIAKYQSWATVFFSLELLLAGNLILIFFSRNMRIQRPKHHKEN